MKKIHFVPNRCIGCEECLVACAKAHDWHSRAFLEVVDGYFPVPMRCSHCDDAPCKAACPTEAIVRNQFGAIAVNQDKCIGCGTCAEVCPFGIPVINSVLGKMLKCDLCSDIIEDQDPVCVQACPKEALVFVEQDEPLMNRRQRMARNIKNAATWESDPANRQGNE